MALTAFKYGFVCIVIGATHPIGKAITQELAGKCIPRSPFPSYLFPSMAIGGGHIHAGCHMHTGISSYITRYMI